MPPALMSPVDLMLPLTVTSPVMLTSGAVMSTFFGCNLYSFISLYFNTLLGAWNDDGLVLLYLYPYLRFFGVDRADHDGV